MYKQCRGKLTERSRAALAADGYLLKLKAERGYMTLTSPASAVMYSY